MPHGSPHGTFPAQDTFDPFGEGPPNGGGVVDPNAWPEGWGQVEIREYLAQLDIDVNAAIAGNDLALAKELALFKANLTGGGGGVDLAVQFAFDVRLANIHADIQIRLDEARDVRDRATQISLKKVQARIDDLARQANFEQDKWLLDKRQAFDAAEAEKGRSFQAEQSRLDRENQQRAQAIQELGALNRQLIETKETARQSLVKLVGSDPLRAAAGLQGRIQRGRTPTDVARTRLQTAADTPLPTISPTATLPELQAQIATTAPQANLPTVTPTLGLPGGGIIEMTRNKMGAFAITPDRPRPDLAGNTGIGIIVGDGEHGEGIKAGTAELIEFQDNGRVRVIPIATRGAGGLEVDTRLGTSGLGTSTTRRASGRAGQVLEQSRRRAAGSPSPCRPWRRRT